MEVHDFQTRRMLFYRPIQSKGVKSTYIIPFAVLFSSDEHCSHLLLQGTFHMLCKIPAVRQLPMSIES